MLHVVHGAAKSQTRLSDWTTTRQKMNMDWYIVRWVYLFKEIIPECFYLFLLWFLIFQTYKCFQNLWLLLTSLVLGAMRGHSRPWTIVWASVSPAWDSDLVWKNGSSLHTLPFFFILPVLEKSSFWFSSNNEKHRFGKRVQ